LSTIFFHISLEPEVCYNVPTMIESYFEAFTALPFGIKTLITFLMSMVPVIELRGALPIGVVMGLDPRFALVVCILGNMVPVPFIILFIRHILNWMKKFEKFRVIAEKLEAKAKKHEGKIEKYEALGLFILVALPLPGTGAWTGSLVAALFDIRLSRALPIIFAGVITAGIIVFLITYGAVALF